MAKALLLAAALTCCTVGMAWFALALDAHWRQATGEETPGPAAARALRVLGTLALLVALALCLAADHATMAALVWMMALAAAALMVAFTLSWQPQWLAWLAARRPGPGSRDRRY